MPEKTADLTGEVRAELAALAEKYGTPRLVSALIGAEFYDPIKRPDRIGEVCMVIRRPSGKILLSTKDFYPPGAYRIPTGGIAHGEGVLDALLRETHEETGLQVEVRRFLAWIDYEGPAVGGDEKISFHTFAFLMDEVGGTLGALDPDERILDYREMDVADLPSVAEHLEGLAGLSTEIVGDWGDWGRFRAVVHRAVHEALAS